MSTISPAATRTMAERLRERGAEMLDAPVARRGPSTAPYPSWLAGPRPLSPGYRVLPLFEVMGRNIVHVGDNGAGQVCKACNQIAISHPWPASVRPC